MGLSFGSMSAYLRTVPPPTCATPPAVSPTTWLPSLGAALTPFVAVWLNSSFGVAAVGGYLAFASILSVVFIPAHSRNP